MKQLTSLFVILLTLLASSGFRYSEGYKVGDTAMDFQLKNVDGKTISLAGNEAVKGYILVFTCNTCPVAQAYEDRIIALHNQYTSQGYPVIAINSNDSNVSSGDSYEQMQKKANDKQYPFAYVWDETQNIAKTYGANRTPQVFIVKKEGSAYKVMYIGAVDDHSEEASGAQKKYVEEAMKEIIAGKPVTTSFTRTVGCSIKWRRA